MRNNKWALSLLFFGVMTWHTKAFENTLSSKVFINQCLNQEEQLAAKITPRPEVDRDGFIIWYPDYGGYPCIRPGRGFIPSETCSSRCDQ